MAEMLHCMTADLYVITRKMTNLLADRNLHQEVFIKEENEKKTRDIGHFSF